MGEVPTLTTPKKPPGNKQHCVYRTNQNNIHTSRKQGQGVFWILLCINDHNRSWAKFYQCLASGLIGFQFPGEISNNQLWKMACDNIHEVRNITCQGSKHDLGERLADMALTDWVCPTRHTFRRACHIPISMCHPNFPYTNFPNQPRRPIHLAISNTGIIVTAKPPTISQSAKGRA
jgi:hypothetical protein